LRRLAASPATSGRSSGVVLDASTSPAAGSSSGGSLRPALMPFSRRSWIELLRVRPVFVGAPRHSQPPSSTGQGCSAPNHKRVMVSAGFAIRAPRTGVCWAIRRPPILLEAHERRSRTRVRRTDAAAGIESARRSLRGLRAMKEASCGIHSSSRSSGFSPSWPRMLRKRPARLARAGQEVRRP